MSRRARVVVLLAAVLTTACGEPRLIGRSCGPQGCPLDVLGEPPADSCGAQFELPPIEIESGTSRERCHLFTLDRLDAPQGGDRVFVTLVEVASGPAAHDLDLRLATELPDFEDGEVDCLTLGARAVPWIPLLTTQGTRETWSFDPAPLVASRRHRLLVNDGYANLTGAGVLAGVRVNLHCASNQPESVSQAFEFTSREHRIVNPGVRATVAASCVFSREVLVSRLYRRTRFVTDYSVRRRGETAPLWPATARWFVELDPPLRIAEDDGFRWECVYENRSDLPFQIGGTSSDTCSLLGLYRLPGGGTDDRPEHCIVF